MAAMTTIDVGSAELRALVKVLSAASSGGHVSTTAKERAALSALYVRLTRFGNQ